MAGLEKRNRILNPQERRVIAVHEMGHALVAMVLPGMDRVHKVSIIPRGIGALGYTIQRPTEDRYLMSRQELQNKMTVLLAGRAAELLLVGDASTGAADDLVKATDIARSMVLRFGMDETLGHVAYEDPPSPFLGQLPDGMGASARRFSPQTGREIDCAVRALTEAALRSASEILSQHRALLERGSQELLALETLSEDQVRALLEMPAKPQNTPSAG